MKFIAILVPLATMLLSGQANASAQSGYVTSFYSDSGRFLFFMNGARGPTPPSCSINDNRWELSVDPTSELGKIQVSELMTAEATHQPIYVSGSDDCSGSDAERVIWFRINP